MLRRFIIGAFAVVVLCGQTVLPGFPPGTFQSRGAIDAGIAYDVATTAWVNAVVTAGGTVSTTQKGYVNTLIVNLKTQYATNYFTSCDRIWIPASENATQASIDIVNLAALTPHTSPTFTANQGYTSNGTSSYIDSGFKSGTNFTAPNASFSVYNRTSRTASSSTYLLGAIDGTFDTVLEPLAGSGFASTTVNFGSTFFPLVSNGQGMWVVTRTGTAGAAYVNGSVTAAGTGSLTNSGVPTVNEFILAVNFEGSATGWGTDQVAEVSFCGNFTATQASQFAGIINAYMTAIGSNVY